MDPIAPSTPTTGEPLVEFVRTKRQNAGLILATLAVLFLGSAVYLYVKAGSVPKTAEKAAEKLKLEEPESPDAKAEVVNPKRTDYLLGFILTLVAGLATGVLALWLIGGLPESDEAAQRTTARKQILAAGGVLGVLLMFAGAVYFYQWVDALGVAFEAGKEKELVWVVVPLLLVLSGAALMMATMQPARTEERNNPALRRLVYGSNLALTAMLLFVVLVAGNAVIANEVSSKFDTTLSGFYSMSDQTRDFLAGLDQRMLGYAILPGTGQRQENDLRDVLTRFQEASHDKFSVTFLSSISNSVDLANLKVEYPTLQEGTMGVLITFANDRKRFSFIPIEDFFSVDRNPMEGEKRVAFIGESKLIRELMFLADNKQKPKVYFTQSADEMQLAGAQTPPTRSISGLQSFLEKNYLDIVPLKFDETNPKVPDDCSILVVADPQITLPPKQVEAILKYMTEPLPGGRKGKLIVLAGAVGIESRAPKMIKTGLEPLLTQFHVNLHDKFVFGLYTALKINPLEPFVTISRELAEKRHPLALLLSGTDFSMPLPRAVEARSEPGAFTATPFLTTATDAAWEEDQIPRDFQKSVVIAQETRQLRRRLPVGVVVSEGTPTGQDSREGTTARMAVIGNGLFVSDALTSDFSTGDAPTFNLMGGVIDWLRDRPPIPSGVTSKTYSQYALSNAKTVDKSRLEYLPLGLMLIAVSGIGLGVWITRRQQQ